MSDFVTELGRGKHATGLGHLAGTTKRFKNTDPTDPTKLLSEEDVICKRVKNASGSALLPGRSVKYSTSAWGTEISGYTATGDRSDGFVDDHLPAAGVPNNSYFWLIIGGPCNFVSNGAAEIAINDILVTADDGKVKEQDASPADEDAVVAEVNSKCGYARAAATNVDGTVFRGQVALL